MNKIASVCHLFSIGSICIFGVTIFISLIAAIRSISVSNVHEANKKIRYSNLFSFLVCILIDYFMSV